MARSGPGGRFAAGPWPTMTAASLLERGDAVGIVAPGFAVHRRELASGVERLEALGYRPRLGEHVHDRDGYLAGDDDARAADLQRALDDPDVRAIWFARGGYGTARLLPRLDWRRFRRRPKPLIGYSDVTAVQAAALRRSAVVCPSAPVVSELGLARSFHGPSLRATLAGRPFALPHAQRQVLRPGRAAGRLVGGNLSVLIHLIGTRQLPAFHGCVLFLEEVGETVYRLDRMLTQLVQSRVLDGVRAVLLGGLGADPRRPRRLANRPLSDLLAESFLPLRVPVVTDLPCGHVRAKRTLPLGGRVRVDTAAGRLELTPRAVAPSRRPR